jgi:hypothetical protein
MDDIRSQMEGLEPETFEDPEERDRISCFECGEEFLVEHVGDDEGWVCPACAHPNLNLHKHFVALGIIFAVLALAGLGLTINYALAYGEEENIAFFFLMWSAINTTVSGYVVMAIFGDKRAYGLRALRYLMPGLYASAIGAAIVYWFPFNWITVIVAGLAFVAIGLYGAYVFWHTLRMAMPHRPRDSVVRPMYTLISVTVHVLLLLYMALVTVVVMERTPGTSEVEFGRPGGYVPQQMRAEELQTEEEEPEIEEEEIEPELEEIETVENRQDIDYATDNMVVFNKTDIEEKPRVRPRQRQRNVRYEPRYNRDYALKQGGGSDATEWAVLQALRWLKKQQNPDGSWGEPPIMAAMTGLALLCFLGHGEDHLSVEFGATVRAAISWFVAQQDEDGYFTKEHRWAYQHGIASYAMSEAYGMTGLEDLRPVVAKAIRRICEGQTPEGGWYYGYTKVQNDGSPWAGGDTSVCAWQVQALTAASYAGIRFSNNMLRDTRRRAIADLKSRFSEDGGFGYQGTAPSRSKEDNYTTTAIGTLCLQFLGQHSSREVKGGLNIMRHYSCDWKRTTGGAGAPLYAWYYVTQAMYHATTNPQSNVYWKYWNPLFSKLLVNKQQPDGHWEPAEGGGNFVKGSFAGKNKDLYATTMCCLMLEVYYRYLPTYRPTH